MDLSIRVAFSAIDKLTRPVSAASKAIGGLSDSLKNTVFNQRQKRVVFRQAALTGQRYRAKLRSTQRAFDGLNQKQREGGQLTEAQTARLETLRNKLSRLTDTYNKQTTQLRAAGQAVRQHGVNLNAGSGAVQSAIRRTEQYSRALERERQRPPQSRARRPVMRGRRKPARNFAAVARWQLLARALPDMRAGASAPAVGFDEEMSRVQALTRLDKGDSQLAALRAQAKSSARKRHLPPATPQVVRRSLQWLASLHNQSGRHYGVLNMALAGGMELGESADIDQTSFLNLPSLPVKWIVSVTC